MKKKSKVIGSISATLGIMLATGVTAAAYFLALPGCSATNDTPNKPDSENQDQNNNQNNEPNGNGNQGSNDSNNNSSDEHSNSDQNSGSDDNTSNDQSDSNDNSNQNDADSSGNGSENNNQQDENNGNEPDINPSPSDPLNPSDEPETKPDNNDQQNGSDNNQGNDGDQTGDNNTNEDNNPNPPAGDTDSNQKPDGEQGSNPDQKPGDSGDNNGQDTGDGQPDNKPNQDTGNGQTDGSEQSDNKPSEPNVDNNTENQDVPPIDSPDIPKDSENNNGDAGGNPDGQDGNQEQPENNPDSDQQNDQPGDNSDNSGQENGPDNNQNNDGNQNGDKEPVPPVVNPESPETDGGDKGDAGNEPNNGETGNSNDGQGNNPDGSTGDNAGDQQGQGQGESNPDQSGEQPGDKPNQGNDGQSENPIEPNPNQDHLGPEQPTKEIDKNLADKINEALDKILIHNDQRPVTQADLKDPTSVAAIKEAIKNALKKLGIDESWIKDIVLEPGQETEGQDKVNVKVIIKFTDDVKFGETVTSNADYEIDKTGHQFIKNLELDKQPIENIQPEEVPPEVEKPSQPEDNTSPENPETTEPEPVVPTPEETPVPEEPVPVVPASVDFNLTQLNKLDSIIRNKIDSIAANNPLVLTAEKLNASGETSLATEIINEFATKSSFDKDLIKGISFNNPQADAQAFTVSWIISFDSRVHFVDSNTWTKYDANQSSYTVSLKEPVTIDVSKILDSKRLDLIKSILNQKLNQLYNQKENNVAFDKVNTEEFINTYKQELVTKLGLNAAIFQNLKFANNQSADSLIKYDFEITFTDQVDFRNGDYWPNGMVYDSTSRVLKWTIEYNTYYTLTDSGIQTLITSCQELVNKQWETNKQNFTSENLYQTCYWSNLWELLKSRGFDPSYIVGTINFNVDYDRNQVIETIPFTSGTIFTCDFTDTDLIKLDKDARTLTIVYNNFNFDNWVTPNRCKTMSDIINNKLNDIYNNDAKNFNVDYLNGSTIKQQLIDAIYAQCHYQQGIVKDVYFTPVPSTNGTYQFFINVDFTSEAFWVTFDAYYAGGWKSNPNIKEDGSSTISSYKAKSYSVADFLNNEVSSHLNQAVSQTLAAYQDHLLTAEELNAPELNAVLLNDIRTNLKTLYPNFSADKIQAVKFTVSSSDGGQTQNIGYILTFDDSIKNLMTDNVDFSVDGQKITAKKPVVYHIYDDFIVNSDGYITTLTATGKSKSTLDFESSDYQAKGIANNAIKGSEATNIIMGHKFGALDIKGNIFKDLVNNVTVDFKGADNLTPETFNMIMSTDPSWTAKIDKIILPSAWESIAEVKTGLQSVTNTFELELPARCAIPGNFFDESSGIKTTKVVAHALTDLGYASFYGNHYIQSFDCELDKLETNIIQYGMFYNADKLNHCNLLSTESPITEIGDWAFAGYYSSRILGPQLEDVSWPSKLNKPGSYSFSLGSFNFKDTETARLPETVTTITSCAFYWTTIKINGVATTDFKILVPNSSTTVESWNDGYLIVDLSHV